ncbi:MAG TPA: MsnO8 family LLM class oxidoreductase, partial [Chitinophagales bacterium]
MKNIPISVLELAIVSEGNNTAEAISNTVNVAQHAEALGYKRIWLAEHHNMEHIASSATAVLIGHVAGLTNGKIRVGSGGIMLPNHSPLAVAEQFGTLASIYPNRIDLGLGRAPGTDQLTALALRRNNAHIEYDFEAEILQLQTYFSTANKH